MRKASRLSHSTSEIEVVKVLKRFGNQYRRTTVKYATFYTDDWQAYKGVIPDKQHQVVKKQSRKTNHIERFNCTLRQRVSRLFRKSLSLRRNWKIISEPSSISFATTTLKKHDMYLDFVTLPAGLEILKM